MISFCESSQSVLYWPSLPLSLSREMLNIWPSSHLCGRIIKINHWKHLKVPFPTQSSFLFRDHDDEEEKEDFDHDDWALQQQQLEETLLPALLFSVWCDIGPVFGQ